MTPVEFLKTIFKEKKGIFFSFIITALLARVLDLCIPYVFKLLTDEANLYINGELSSYASIWLLCMGLCFVAFLGRFLFRVADYIEAKFTPKLSEEISSKLFTYITNHSVSYFQNNFSGAIAHKIKQIAEITKYFFTIYTVTILQVFTVLIFSCSIIYTKSILLSLFILCFGSIYVYFSYFMAKKSKLLASEWSDQSSKVTGNLIDSIENMILVKSLAKANQEVDTIKEHLAEEKTKLTELKIYMVKTKIVHVLISSFIITSSLLSSIYLLINHIITMGDFFFIFMMITRLTNEFATLGDITTDILEKYGTLKESLSFIYKDQEDNVQQSNININNGEIHFNNVTFGYKPNHIILNSINLKIKGGEKIALVGHSGSGKSTLTKLILRQYKPKIGEILIDGSCLNDFNIDSINEKITYIHQNVYLFNRSIRDNILYAKPGATEEELIEVCIKSGCLEFIQNKEKGFDTIIGERGVQLSGGEKQRLALARAFLLNNPILILDEPTSALDSVSEKLIQESLNELIKGKTVIIIAHRLSTIKHMDRVLVMDHGKIIEEGSHEELLQKNGAYANLWNIQTY